MFSRLSNHEKGLMLAGFGGFMLTVDIPLMRLAEGTPWSVMLLRSCLVIAAAGIYIAARRWRTGRTPTIIAGRAGFAALLLYGASTTCLLLAVYHTTTANLVFILAFSPMFTALLSWAFLGERPRLPTLLAMIAMAGGVAIIVHEGLGHGHLVGDLLALATTMFLAGAITISRGSGRDMSLAPMIGSFAPLVLSIAMVSQTGFRLDLPWWIVIDGLIVLPISYFCLAAAPRYLYGPEVAMFYLLETVVTPIWIWMIFAEVPGKQSTIGGTILVIALIAHSTWQLRRRRSS